LQRKLRKLLEKLKRKSKNANLVSDKYFLLLFKFAYKIEIIIKGSFVFINSIYLVGVTLVSLRT